LRRQLQAAISLSSTKTCRRLPSGGAVAKIFPLTRNEVSSKCGSSLVPGSDSANVRALSMSAPLEG